MGVLESPGKVLDFFLSVKEWEPCRRKKRQCCIESDSSPYFWDSDLDSDFAHETKVKAIHELLVND